MSLGRNLVTGAIAGAAGTAAMDFLLYRRYQSGGGKEALWRWEFAGDVTTWEGASASGKLGQKVEHRVTGAPPPDTWARRTTNIVHWATGIGWGVQYGVVASVVAGRPLLRAALLGPTACLSGYVILPLAGVYEPIWKYDLRTLWEDLSAHLVYGVTTSAVFAISA